MSDTAPAPPTSAAATKETEPEVVAAISSAEGEPGLPTSFRSGLRSNGYGKTAMLFASACAIGYGVAMLMQRRDQSASAHGDSGSGTTQS